MSDCRVSGLGLLVVVLALVSSPAAAQYEQYAAPGQGALSEDTASKEDRLRDALAKAPWRLGPIRLAPWLGLKQIGYVDNVYGRTAETTSDFTATVGAGLHGYLPLGRKAVLAAHVLPEYVWWRELEDRRLWNWNSGVGVFAFFNRLSLEATAGSVRAQVPLNFEFEAPVNLRRDRAAAGLELRLHDRVSLFGAGSVTGYRFRDEDVERLGGQPLRFLDRDEERLSGGLRYHWRPNVTISGGVELSRVDFTEGERDRSTRSTAPLFEVRVDGNRFDARARVVWASLEPVGGSQFPESRTTLGSFSLGFTPGARLGWRLYGGRNLVYAYESSVTHYAEDRVGLGLSLPMGWRTVLGGFTEWGRRSLGVQQGGAGSRGNSASYGGTVSFLVREQTRLLVRVARTRYERLGGLPETTITRITATLGLGAGVSEWW